MSVVPALARESRVDVLPCPRSAWSNQLQRRGRSGRTSCRESRRRQGPTIAGQGVGGQPTIAGQGRDLLSTAATCTRPTKSSRKGSRRSRWLLRCDVDLTQHRPVVLDASRRAICHVVWPRGRNRRNTARSGSARSSEHEPQRRAFRAGGRVRRSKGPPTCVAPATRRGRRMFCLWAASRWRSSMWAMASARRNGMQHSSLL